MLQQEENQQLVLFEPGMKSIIPAEDSGASFSNDRQYRYALWRIWDRSKPLVMFIGLNPSTANETKADNTIHSVMRIARHNGYGGVYMLNCWPMVATNPKFLKWDELSDEWNAHTLRVLGSICQDVVFAWGNFKVVQKQGRDQELLNMFPSALCIGKNRNGSPKHPLFQKGTSKLKPFMIEIVEKPIKQIHNGKTRKDKN